MFRTVLAAGVVALAVAGSAIAQEQNSSFVSTEDTLRLDGDAADTLRLDGKGEDAEVEDARYGGGGFRGGFAYRGGGYRGGFAVRGGYWGGYRGGYWGGYRGGWGRGYYGRGFGYGYGGFYRPYFGLGFYRGGYYGGGYYGGGYGGYAYPAYSPYYVSPCATTVLDVSPSVTLVQPSVPATPGDATFPYDGGPRDGFIAPTPANPTFIPGRPISPRDGLPVSLPATSQYQYLAFGEQPATATPAPTQRPAQTLRVSYQTSTESSPIPATFSGGANDFSITRR